MKRKNPTTARQWHRRFLQQTLWTTTIRNYLFNKIDITGESRILEVGCGTCAVLSQIPTNHTQSFGVDLKLEYLNYAHHHFKPLHLAQGDGHLLPYSSDVFDLVFCHYLLLWVEDPLKILWEFKRVCKNGSKIVIFAEPDYGGRIDAPPELENLGIAQTKSLKLQGADPFIGRNLPRLAYSAGLKNLEFGVLGSQSTPAFDYDFVESEWEMLYHDLSGQIDEKTLKKYQMLDEKAWTDGTRVLFIPTFYLFAENA